MLPTYLLHIQLEKSKYIRIGRLGKFHFIKGNYIYVGSAKRNMKGRILRHFKKRKKRFWHVDYLLKYGAIKGFWTLNISEEKTAAILSKKLIVPVIGFGSSDKKSRSHLFYFDTKQHLLEIIPLLTEFKKGL